MTTKELRPWTPTSTRLPPEGKVVATMVSTGEVTKLKRRGNIWLYPDDSMYVYYVPKFWQELT